MFVWRISKTWTSVSVALQSDTRFLAVSGISFKFIVGLQLSFVTRMLLKLSFVIYSGITLLKFLPLLCFVTHRYSYVLFSVLILNLSVFQFSWSVQCIPFCYLQVFISLSDLISEGANGASWLRNGFLHFTGGKKKTPPTLILGKLFPYFSSTPIWNGNEIQNFLWNSDSFIRLADVSSWENPQTLMPF